jgi:hypothetical protein
VLYAKQFLKDIRAAASRKPTETRTAEVPHDSDTVMGDNEVEISNPHLDEGNRIERYNLRPGANASVLVGDRTPPARVIGTAPLLSDQRDRTRERRLEELRAEEKIVKAELDLVFAKHQVACAESVDLEFKILRLGG